MTFLKKAKTDRGQPIVYQADKTMNSRRAIIASSNYEPLHSFMNRVRKELDDAGVTYKQQAEVIDQVNVKLEDFLRNNFLAEATLMRTTVTAEQAELGLTLETKELLRKIVLLMPGELRRPHYEDAKFNNFLTEIETEMRRANVRYTSVDDPRLMQYYYLLVYHMYMLRQPQPTPLVNFLDTFMEVLPQFLEPKDNADTIEFNATQLMAVLVTEHPKGETMQDTPGPGEATAEDAVVSAETVEAQLDKDSSEYRWFKAKTDSKDFVRMFDFTSNPKSQPFTPEVEEKLRTMSLNLYASFEKEDTEKRRDYVEWLEIIAAHAAVSDEYPTKVISHRSKYFSEMKKGWFGADLMMCVMKHVQSLPDYEIHFSDYIKGPILAKFASDLQKKLTTAGFRRVKEDPENLEFFEVMALSYFFTLYEMNVSSMPQEGVIASREDLGIRLGPQTEAMSNTLMNVISYFVRKGDEVAINNPELQSAVMQIVYAQFKELNVAILDKNGLDHYVNVTPAETHNSPILHSQKETIMQATSAAPFASTTSIPDTRSELEIRMDQLVNQRVAEFKTTQEVRNKQIDEALISINRTVEDMVMRQSRHEAHTNERLVQLERRNFGDEGVALVDRIRARAWNPEIVRTSTTTDLTMGEKVALGAMGAVAIGGIGYAAYSLYNAGNNGGDGGQLGI